MVAGRVRQAHFFFSAASRSFSAASRASDSACHNAIPPCSTTLFWQGLHRYSRISRPVNVVLSTRSISPLQSGHFTASPVRELRRPFLHEGGHAFLLIR